MASSQIPTNDANEGLPINEDLQNQVVLFIKFFFSTPSLIP